LSTPQFKTQKQMCKFLGNHQFIFPHDLSPVISSSFQRCHCKSWQV